MINKDAEQIKNNIGKILKIKRIELELSQEQIAARTGLGQAMISKIELGKGNPSIKSIIEYCNCVNIDLERLIRGQ